MYTETKSSTIFSIHFCRFCCVSATILFTIYNSKNFEQICDFGLAKWLPKQWTHHIVSKFEGTFGFVNLMSFSAYLPLVHIQNSDSSPSCFCSYLPPEYLSHGIVDEKTDVFAFGVLLLELVTGRRALDYSQQSLVLWVSLFFKLPLTLAFMQEVAKFGSIILISMDGYCLIHIFVPFVRQSRCWRRTTWENLLILS